MNTHNIAGLEYIDKINSILILYQNSNVLKVMGMDEKMPSKELDIKSQLIETGHFGHIISFDYHNNMLYLSMDTK
jgi:hypothetical protein